VLQANITGKYHQGESMKITIYLLLVTLAFGEMASNANASAVLGSISCKQWMDRQNKPAESEAYAIWIEGYLSGANAMYGEMLDRDFIKMADNISIINWTDAYCQKYPKMMLHDSTNALIKLLKRDTPY
jgi:dissimilatory sulfite reductase (desulfoviridin) alpha/beta subunit